MAPTQDTFADRCKAVRQFVSDYTDARIESPHQYDDSELPPMYDDYRTRAEIAVVHSAVERGVIPDALDTQNQLGPKPIDTYAVQIHVEEWQRSADLERDAAKARLREIKAMEGSGKSNQWRAYREHLRRAVEWLLGEHPEQTEESND